MRENTLVPLNKNEIDFAYGGFSSTLKVLAVEVVALGIIVNMRGIGHAVVSSTIFLGAFTISLGISCVRNWGNVRQTLGPNAIKALDKAVYGTCMVAVQSLGKKLFQGNETATE